MVNFKKDVLDKKKELKEKKEREKEEKRRRHHFYHPEVLKVESCFRDLGCKLTKKACSCSEINSTRKRSSVAIIVDDKFSVMFFGKWLFDSLPHYNANSAYDWDEFYPKLVEYVAKHWEGVPF